jgi:hypothetical protein
MNPRIDTRYISDEEGIDTPPTLRMAIKDIQGTAVEGT